MKEPFGEGREVVTIEAFNRFVEWFGPIKEAAPSGSAPATTPEPTTQLFTRILTTLAQPYAFLDHPGACCILCIPHPCVVSCRACAVRRGR